VWRRLQPVPQAITLERQAGGVSAGTFTETTVPGFYRIVVRVEGDDPDVGEIRRLQTVTAVVRFGKADPAASETRVTETGRDPGGRHIQVSLRPRDRHGNFLGPGYAHRIKVSTATGSVASAPLDGLDGTYVLPLLVPPTGDPLVAIWVMDSLLFQGPVSRLHTSSRGEWGYWIAVILLIATLLAAAWQIIAERRTTHSI
jgi:hypothetical protein